MAVAHLSLASSAVSRPTGPGLRDLALRWLRPMTARRCVWCAAVALPRTGTGMSRSRR